ncbi:Aste57867_13567 [Aphanomyces stellatus]|uniref:thioredoxin-dependent peroxiredoxin n=1 Tax=Aphanomyces stellatus TaxID=120398 RepID=A0A485KYG7_9STRA|nr:hypothetical protein As57867_013517 [Aphanomyces stellatus]VFT90405.1 Aste57867_13567 [Aphanomyces stellatus]
MTEVRRSKRLAGSAPATAAPAKKAKKSPTKKANTKAAKTTDENAAGAANTDDKPVAAPKDEETPVADEDDKKPAPADAPKTLKVGDSVPNVELRNEGDEVVHVHDLVKEKGAVFFMFPKADTPGCTKQACGFRDEYEKFTAAGYNVFALSGDSPSALNKWKTKKELPYKLLSDTKHALIAPFGSSKPGKKVQRSHVIVAAGGAIVEIQGQISPADSVSKAVAFVTKA